MMAKLQAGGSVRERLVALLAHVRDELRAQDPATGPVTKTGDVAADLDAAGDRIADAVDGGGSTAAVDATTGAEKAASALGEC